MSVMTSAASSKKSSKTAILVTHDISEAISMADRVIILSARPAHIARIVPIRLSLDERTPLAAARCAGI